MGINRKKLFSPYIHSFMNSIWYTMSQTLKTLDKQCSLFVCRWDGKEILPFHIIILSWTDSINSNIFFRSSTMKTSKIISIALVSLTLEATVEIDLSSEPVGRCTIRYLISSCQRISKHIDKKRSLLQTALFFEFTVKL